MQNSKLFIKKTKYGTHALLKRSKNYTFCTMFFHATIHIVYTMWQPWLKSYFGKLTGSSIFFVTLTVATWFSSL